MIPGAPDWRRGNRETFRTKQGIALIDQGNSPPGVLTPLYVKTRVLSGLDEDIDDVPILIDGTPEIAPLSLDGDEDLVQVPDVAPPALSTLEPASV